MYMITITTATPITSAKPRKNIPPSNTSKPMVNNSRCLSWPKDSEPKGQKELEMICSAASAAERVLVITKSVAAKPRRVMTKALPTQPCSNFSSIPIEPKPRNDLLAT